MQRRWFCFGCLREWLYAVNWSEGEPCPACQHANVHPVDYKPGFPGADLPRNLDGSLAQFGVDVSPPSTRWVEVMPPPPMLMPQIWEGDGA